MDYQSLAREYMVTLHQLRRRNNQDKITDSMRGEHFVLKFLSMHGGRAIPSEISKEMGISTARIAAALGSLESKGLITRRIDERDRRRILVELTDAGRAQQNEHENMIMGMLEHMLRNLGETDSLEFLRILKRIAEHPPEEFFRNDPAIK